MMELLKVLVLLSLLLVVTSSVFRDTNENRGSTEWVKGSVHNEKIGAHEEDGATDVTMPMNVQSIRTQLSTTARCERTFCHGISHGACCPGLFCVQPSATTGTCRKCSGDRGFCGGGFHPPCCAGLFCIQPSAISETCRKCASRSSFCGGGFHPPCCSGLFCANGVCR